MLADSIEALCLGGTKFLPKCSDFEYTSSRSSLIPLYNLKIDSRGNYYPEKSEYSTYFNDLIKPTRTVLGCIEFNNTKYYLTPYVDGFAAVKDGDVTVRRKIGGVTNLLFTLLKRLFNRMEVTPCV